MTTTRIQWYCTYNMKYWRQKKKKKISCYFWPTSLVTDPQHTPCCFLPTYVVFDNWILSSKSDTMIWPSSSYANTTSAMNLYSVQVGGGGGGGRGEMKREQHVIVNPNLVPRPLPAAFQCCRRREHASLVSEVMWHMQGRWKGDY